MLHTQLGLFIIEHDGLCGTSTSGVAEEAGGLIQLHCSTALQTEEECMAWLLRKAAEDSDCKLLAIIPSDGKLHQFHSSTSALEHPPELCVAQAIR